MTQDLDITAEAKRLAKEGEPTGGYGCVYELWQQAYDLNLRDLLGSPKYSDEQAEALKAELIRIGALTADDTDMYERDENTCIHFLDARTCPMGCFE